MLLRASKQSGSGRSQLEKVSPLLFHVLKSTLKMKVLVKNNWNSSGTVLQGTAVWTWCNGRISKDTQPFGINTTRRIMSEILQVLAQTHAKKQPSTDNCKLWNGWERTAAPGMPILVMLRLKVAISPSCNRQEETAATGIVVLVSLLL